MYEKHMNSLSIQQERFLSEVQVNLGVEVGKLCISAAQLIDLVPGQVFEFEFDPLAPVLLSLGEEEIGEARFVLQGEKLALEVMSLKDTTNTNSIGNNSHDSGDYTYESKNEKEM